MPPRPRPAEKGSVLIYIFIAIIALAALVFAVSNSNREGMSTVDRERSELLATQILDYTGMIRRSLQMMTTDGIDDTELCFHTARWGHNDYNHAGCAEERNQVFALRGGGAVWQDPSEDIFDSSLKAQPEYGKWVYSGANAVAAVGSDCGVPGDAECNELLMVLPYIKRNVCLALNRRLQVDTSGIVPQDNPNFNITAKYNGQYVNGQVLDNAVLHGRRSGCFQTQTTPADKSYAFFAVLVAR